MKKRTHYNIDHAIWRGDLLFGHGWLFHEDSELSELQLRGGNITVSLEYGGPRPDVFTAYPNAPQAKQSGFLFYARLPSAEAAQLVARFSNGEILEIPLKVSPQPSRGQPLLNTVFRRFFTLLKQGNMNGILEKSKRYLRYWALPSANLGLLLKNIDDVPLTVIVDHSLGGGTNHYREQRLASYLAQNKDVLVITYHPALLGYRIEHHTRQAATQHYKLDNLETLFTLASKLTIETLFYNNAVSFPDAIAIPGILVALAERMPAKLEIALHDFFPFCPSPHLMNAEGKFCRLPDNPQTCHACLLKSHQSFVPIYGIQQIPVWRQQWRKLMIAADVIHVFSKHMITTLHAVYPDIERSAIHYVPHSTAYFEQVTALDPPAQPLRIGIVGNITPIKGSGVVTDLAHALAEAGRHDIELIVIGTLHARSNKAIRQTGHYQHDDLPGILTREKVNMILFPSICPETFSFVIQEMKRLALPVAAFDLGAQAEYLADYPKGLILPLETPPAELLANLVAFHQKLYPFSS